MSSSNGDIVGLFPQRACRNCVQIKVKCIPREGPSQNICQRCYRLNKHCTTALPAARKRRRVVNSKVSQLEDKINQLTNLLTKPSGADEESEEQRSGLRSQRSLHSSITPPGNNDAGKAVAYRVDDHESEAQYTRQHSHIQSFSIMAGYDDSIRDPAHPISPPETSEGRSNTNRDYGSPDVTQERSVIQSNNPLGRDHLIEACTGPVNDPYYGFSCTRDSQVNNTSTTGVTGPFDGAMAKRDTSTSDFCPLFLDPKLEHDLFEAFRASMTHFYPFVVVKSTITAQQLKHEKPFLFWACIIAASHHHRTMHRKLNEEILKGIGEYVLLKGAKSLDLLQGILVLVAWYHYYAHLNPQWMNLIHLAQAMVVDLGYSKSPTSSVLRNHLAADAAELLHGRKVNSGLTTNDERRALLGCYVLTGKVRQCFHRLDGMKYTKHMHDCFLELEKESEVQSDTYLLQLVRLQRIMGKYVKDDLISSKIPSHIYSRMFEDDVQQYEVAVPSALRNNPHIVAEIKSCKVCFYQPAQIDDFETSQARAEVLHACLSAIDEFYEIFLSIPMEEFDSMTFSTWFSKMHCLTVLGQLSFLNVDGWDVQYVRTKVNLAAIVQKLADKFEAINNYHKEIMTDQIPWRFAVYAERMRRIKNWFEAKVNAEQTAIQNQAADVNNPPLDTFTASLFDMDFDDALWRDIMGNFTNI